MQAKATRHGPPISEEEIRQVGAYARSLYHNGTPLFSMQTIRRLGLELAEATRGRKPSLISVDGLGGVPVEFEVEIGRVAPAIWPGLEVVV